MKTTNVIAGILLCGWLVTGCTPTVTTPIKVPTYSSQPTVTTKVPIFSSVRTITFPDSIVVPFDFEPGDSTDPEQLVLFGLDLYAKKHFKKAAVFFQKAAACAAAGSRGDRFRQACYESAAICFYQAGDIEYFHLMMDSVRSELDEFQRARMPDQTCMLLAISDKLRGNATDLNYSLPLQVKQLFESTH